MPAAFAAGLSINLARVMPLNEATYEQLERWLRGELAADELAAFEARLASEPGLLEEAEWLTNAQEVMHDEGRAAFKQMLAEIGAGVGATALAAYTPTRNAIPKWKLWLKKFWWIPVATLAAVSAIAFALTAVQITREDHPPLIPDEMLNAPEGKTDSVKEEKPGQVPVIPEKDSVESKSKPKTPEASVSKTAPLRSGEQIGQNYNGDEISYGYQIDSVYPDLMAFTNKQHHQLIYSLFIDSAYTSEQVLKSLKRRKIDFTKPSPGVTK
ncbi:MAG: hypothetical protein IM638_03445 [Bacteroidetes bacterium]|nr:hypothetical protein [Bacteroidota bacterium]